MIDPAAKPNDAPSNRERKAVSAISNASDGDGQIRAVIGGTYVRFRANRNIMRSVSDGSMSWEKPRTGLAQQYEPRSPEKGSAVASP
jgi:hypothetical protein